jgi:aminoglycoside/choline kinase family phosphotransferase
VTPLAADASTRRYFRVRWRAAALSRPASCIMMWCAPWPVETTPDFLSVGEHLRTHGVRVPQLYGVSPDAGLMCLEDYGDCTLAQQWQEGTPAAQLLWGQRAIEELVKMHTRATQDYAPRCPAFHLAFDVPKLLSELQFFREHAIEGLWSQPLPAAEQDAFDTACQPLCEMLASSPRYFCHRDYHGWNIMAQNSTVGVLDFQDARMGPQPYDLASLLLDRGTPELLGHEVMAALTAYYLQRLEAETGQRIDRETFRLLFDYVAVQRCIKAMGTFAAMHVRYQRSQYLPYIVPTLTYLKPLLKRYALLQPLTTLLQRYVPPWQQ